ncbi:TVP38/TMEM64 family protein [Arabiibacter massiliensis]|uniref:TVP38/TMEM64 family protein n=1 Tax=Arabiibacter massiliensis TaxID=1870985 RepID=UPI0009BA6C2A|nr:VTT domain-containing protein [Arabiibacter massiliensis]
MEKTATPAVPAAPKPHAPGADSRRALVRKRVAVIVGLAALTAGIGALWALFGPELLAFVGDAPRFRAWVDEAGAVSRVAFVLANMAQVVLAFLPGEPLELAAGYAFGTLEGTLWCLVASALGTALVMVLVRTFGMRIVGLFFAPEKITSVRWLQDARRFELVLFLVFLIPGTPKDLLTYVAGLGKSPIGRIVALTTAGRIPSIISSTLAAGAFGDGNYGMALAIGALTVALAGIGVLAYRRFMAKHVVIENDSQ